MTFLLVHGLGLSSNIWSRLTPLLDGEVIAVDLPGHGESNATDFSWNGLWETIVDGRAGREWSEIWLVLHSFSACLLPEIISAGVRPEKIILVEGILHPADALWSNELTFLDGDQFDSWLIRFRSVSEIALRSQLCSRQNKSDVLFWSDSFKIVSGGALHQIATQLRNRLGTTTLIEAIKSLRSSIVYLRGSRSRLSRTGRIFLENNSISISYVPFSSHFPMIDNPQGVAELIQDRLL